MGGFLGTGSPLQASLSGSACAPHIVHHVTASATVSAGHTLSASVTVATYTGVVCSITITSPANNSGASPGQVITFTAAAYDDGVFQLPGSAISWSDNIDGPLGTGSPLQHSLTGGACTITQHYVTATATDRFGDQQSTTIAVSVGYIC